MTGNLYIDGFDCYTLFGVYVTGNYNELVAFPSLKPVESNNWHEEDGEEVDLSAPALDTRELNIKFAYHGTEENFVSFINLLSDGAYHQFNFAEIGKMYQLRLVSQPDMSRASTFGVFSLRFADDFPLSGYSYVSPQSNIVPLCGYELDGRDLADYGVRVLQGSMAEIQKIPAVKKNLIVSVRDKSGVVYDGANVTFQAKDVRINCLMRANNLTEFWRNYNALLYDLVRPSERMLYVGSKEYACYYKSCSVSEFSVIGKIWFKFSLNLVFT